VSIISEYLEAFIDLVYPKICAGCNVNAAVHKGIFCLNCLAQLPETHYHKLKGNPFEMHFWGRMKIQSGAAFLFFSPGGITQQLIHNIKYRNQPQYGVKVGQFYGRQLMKSGRFENIDLIVPIPLFWKKQKRRGFNQSAEFASGLSEAMSISWNGKVVKKTKSTLTQTRKSRSDRIENMVEAFIVTDAKKLSGKHILLVDDVLTTGATLEACGLRILNVEDTKLSLVTIGMGRI
jgi:ComF family protein